MTMNKWPYLVLLPMTLLLWSLCPLNADEGDAQRIAAEDMAKLMSAARKVISEKQALFNDPDKGDKGFTPQVFAELAEANYKSMFNLDVHDQKLPNEVSVFWEAMQGVVKDAQPVLNKRGMGYKGFLPAVFARQSSARFMAKFPGAYAKLTNIPDVHNPVNRPDDWEKTVLAKFLDDAYPHGKPYSEIVEMNGKKMLRLIQPEYYVESCLKCHGSPKGDKGPGGVIKCGKKLNQAGAGFSIGLPLN